MFFRKALQVVGIFKEEKGLESNTVSPYPSFVRDKI